MGKFTIAELFWDKVSKECWGWKGSIKPRNGYGHFHHKGKDYNAHRLAWELTFGPIPEGMCVLHKCDTPACVNPSHLKLGTHAENMAEMASRGRSVRGERNDKARLTESQVRELRRDYWCRGRKSNISELYERYKHTGISKSGLYLAASGQSWAHIK